MRSSSLWMRFWALTAVLAVLGLLSSCAQPAAPVPSVSPVGSPDLTEPGQARSMVRRLIAKAGAHRLIQVEITAETALVTVVKGGQTETWAWRDATIKQVDSDVAYVNQSAFTIDDFNLSDVGALFRAAAGISGSQSRQELHIVDSSAGEVFMSVSTNPESRTVFFFPDGNLLPTLDFATESGIRTGLADVGHTRTTALAIGVQSDMGAWLDFPGSTDTTIRRLRTATVPVTINERAQRPELTPFSVSRVRADTIWKVVSDARSSGSLDRDTRWQVTVDDRAGTGTPRMYFTIGSTSLVTDLSGEQLEP